MAFTQTSHFLHLVRFQHAAIVFAPLLKDKTRAWTFSINTWHLEKLEEGKQCLGPQRITRSHGRTISKKWPPIVVLHVVTNQPPRLPQTTSGSSRQTDTWHTLRSDASAEESDINLSVSGIERWEREQGSKRGEVFTYS